MVSKKTKQAPSMYDFNFITNTPTTPTNSPALLTKPQAIEIEAQKAKENPPRKTILQSVVASLDSIFWLTIGGMFNPQKCMDYRNALSHF